MSWLYNNTTVLCSCVVRDVGSRLIFEACTRTRVGEYSTRAALFRCAHKMCAVGPDSPDRSKSAASQTSSAYACRLPVLYDSLAVAYQGPAPQLPRVHGAVKSVPVSHRVLWLAFAFSFWRLPWKRVDVISHWFSLLSSSHVTGWTNLRNTLLVPHHRQKTKK